MTTAAGEAEASPRRKTLGERLIDAGLITPDQLDLALREQKRTGERIGEILINLGFVAQEQIGGPRLPGRRQLRPARQLPDRARRTEMRPESLARRHKLIPILLEPPKLTVALANVFDVSGDRRGPADHRVRGGRRLVHGEQRPRRDRPVLHRRRLHRGDRPEVDPAGGGRPSLRSGSRGGRAHHPARRPDFPDRGAGRGDGYPHGARGAGVPDPVPRRRKAADGAVPPQDAAAGRHRPREDPLRDEHRRDAAAPGRARSTSTSASGRSTCASRRSPRCTGRTSSCGCSTSRSWSSASRASGSTRRPLRASVG